MARPRWKDVACLLALILLVIAYFGRLFYPTFRLIVTPDYGRSDAWHFSYPTKYALWESLKTGTLPLWRSDIGDGFPLFAEGQTGTFFLPNLVAFKFLTPVSAYNLILVTTLITMGIGMYMLARTFSISPIPSLFSALTVTFAGLTVTNFTHITLLQGMSLLPIITAISIRIAKRASWTWVALLSFVVSQQIFAGFPQAVVLTGIFSAACVARHMHGQHTYRPVLMWIIGMMLGGIAGAVQLVPSYEFLRHITDPGGFSQSTATAYSMPVKHIISLIFPFALGNPANGTYPPFYMFDGSIFWENTSYIGILTLIFALSGIFSRRRRPFTLFVLAVAIVSLLFAMGKYAPSYVLYSFWPFNLFRVPSRFLWITLMSLALAAGYFLDTIKNRYVLLIILALQLVVLLAPFWNYHLMEDADTWLSPPALSEKIEGKIITLGEAITHNSVMTSAGWQDPAPYRFLKNGISPDSNMLWGIAQHNVYAGRYLKRSAIVNTLLSGSLMVDEHAATVSATKYLDLFSIANVLSFVDVDAPALTRVGSETSRGKTLTLYKNPSALPRAYLVYEATAAATLTEAVSILSHSAFVPGTTVLLEKHEAPRLTLAKAASHEIRWKRATHDRLDLTVETGEQAILVLTDTYYPGWTATVDGSNTPIYAANLTQRAIVIPKGRHAVTFVYTPASFRRGGFISLLSYGVIMLLGAVPTLVSAVHTRKKILRRAGHP